jgi:hypothetical protein
MTAYLSHMLGGFYGKFYALFVDRSGERSAELLLGVGLIDGLDLALSSFVSDLDSVVKCHNILPLLIMLKVYHLSNWDNRTGTVRVGWRSADRVVIDLVGSALVALQRFA